MAESDLLSYCTIHTGCCRVSTCIHVYPPVLWRCIVPHLQQKDLAAARLVCRDAAAAVDGSSSIRKLQVSFAATSTGLHTPVSLQHSVQHLTADLSSAQAWPQLLSFLQHLPELRSLRCTGKRIWPPLPPPATDTTSSNRAASHAKLTSISFQGFLTSLQELSVLAPNLESLQCHTLVLHAQHTGSSATTASSSASSSTAGSLPHCRYFDAEAVSITAGDPPDGAAAFAAALPALQVLSNTPAFTWSIPGATRMRRSVLPLHQALRFCPSVTAIRVRGVSTAMGGLLPQQLQHLQQLRTLSVYGVGPALELLGISKLTQLTALSLTFELPSLRSAPKLLQEVASLQRLQQLALPAKLLCNKCCRGQPQLLEELLTAWMEFDASSSSNNGAAVAQGSSGGGSGSGSHDASGSGDEEPRLLVLLHRPRAEANRYQLGDFCKHCCAGELAGRAHCVLDIMRRAQAAAQPSTGAAAAGGPGGAANTAAAAAAAQPARRLKALPLPPPGADPEEWWQDLACMLSTPYDLVLDSKRQLIEQQPGPRQCVTCKVGQRQQQGSDSGDVQPPFVIRLAELNNSAVLLRGGGFEEEEQEEEEEEEEEQQQQPARDWAATSGCIWGRFGPADWFC